MDSKVFFICDEVLVPFHSCLESRAPSQPRAFLIVVNNRFMKMASLLCDRVNLFLLAKLNSAMNNKFRVSVGKKNVLWELIDGGPCFCQ